MHTPPRHLIAGDDLDYCLQGQHRVLKSVMVKLPSIGGGKVRWVCNDCFKKVNKWRKKIEKGLGGNI